MQEEAQITCPFCWETLDILLDLSLPEQDYIEDCQVCCRPMEVHVRCREGDVISVETAAA